MCTFMYPCMYICMNVCIDGLHNIIMCIHSTHKVHTFLIILERKWVCGWLFAMGLRRLTRRICRLTITRTIRHHSKAMCRELVRGFSRGRRLTLRESKTRRDLGTRHCINYTRALSNTETRKALTDKDAHTYAFTRTRTSPHTHLHTNTHTNTATHVHTYTSTPPRALTNLPPLTHTLTHTRTHLHSTHIHIDRHIYISAYYQNKQSKVTHWKRRRSGDADKKNEAL